MPQKRRQQGSRSGPGSASSSPDVPPAPRPRGAERIVANDSLLATETERAATSKSLYSDHKARIGSNLSTVRDRARNSAYSCAIQACMPGKNVLHVGCGIGLLSMMAARAGARLVVGVDTSSIVGTATELARRNNLSNVVFVQGRLQSGSVTLPLQHFDVILCEWMGAFVSNDDTFGELEYCVKHHLGPSGIIVPNRATLHVVALSDYNYRCETLDYWDNVYGFNMAPMRPLVLHEATSGSIPRECVASRPSLAYSLDLGTVIANARSAAVGTDAAAAVVELAAYRRYASNFTITVEKRCTVHFLTFYLSASFTDRENPRGNFVLAFGVGDHNPFTEVTLSLPVPIPVFAGDEIRGTLSVHAVKHQHTELELRLICENAAVGNYDHTQRFLYQY